MSISPEVQAHVRRLDTVRDFLHGCISRVLTDCRGQMRLDQVLQKLLSDKAADSLKFTEIKFLVLDMLRGVEFEKIALNISRTAAHQAVICGRRLSMDPAQRAAGALDDYESAITSGGGGGGGSGGSGAAAAGGAAASGAGDDANESKGSANSKGSSDLGQFFLDIEQGVLPYPTVLQQFMDEESTTAALHITNRNQLRDFSAPPKLSAPRAKRRIEFPARLLGGGARRKGGSGGSGGGGGGSGSGGSGSGSGSSEKRAPAKTTARAAPKVKRPVGGISLDF